MKKISIEDCLKEMVNAGESACFIGQVLKLYQLGIVPNRLHFYEGGMTDTQWEYRWQKAQQYFQMLRGQ